MSIANGPKMTDSCPKLTGGVLEQGPVLKLCQIRNLRALFNRMSRVVAARKRDTDSLAQKLQRFRLQPESRKERR